MRIGITLQSLHHLGGIGTYTRHIVKNLIKIDRKNEYILIYPSFGKARKSFGQFKSYPHVTEILSKSTVPHGLYWDHFVVPKLSQKYGIEILFNPFESITLSGEFKKVFVIHNSERFIMPEVFWFFERISGHLRMKAYLRSADRVISVSQKVADDIVQQAGISQDKIRVVHNAPSENFKPIANLSVLGEIRKKYALPEQFFLFVGGIYPQKNFHGLVQAYQMLTRNIPHSLVIAGNLRWKAKHELDLIRRLEVEDRVQMIGWVDHQDLPAIYQLASCFVLPSFHESCSVALLEALACGCPVIASSTGGNPEVVADAALLIDPYDPHALKNAMLRMTLELELRQELTRRGLGRAQRFSWEKSAAATLQVLEEVH
jgi:glycosyltransferase involved in cell wall biosynthesis